MAVSVANESADRGKGYPLQSLCRRGCLPSLSIAFDRETRANRRGPLQVGLRGVPADVGAGQGAEKVDMRRPHRTSLALFVTLPWWSGPGCNPVVAWGDGLSVHAGVAADEQEDAPLRNVVKRFWAALQRCGTPGCGAAESRAIPAGCTVCVHAPACRLDKQPNVATGRGVSRRTLSARRPVTDRRKPIGGQSRRFAARNWIAARPREKNARY